MKNNLTINGFKCFEEASFELNNLTVLCGGNGAGKSSVIQSLLLARLAVERNAYLREGYYDTNAWGSQSVPLNGAYELSLGVFDDILQEYSTEASVEVDGMVLSFGENTQEKDTVSVVVEEHKERLLLCKKEFYYLNAERIGPRYSSEHRSYPFLHCGYKGENTAQVITLCETVGQKVVPGRMSERSSSPVFKLQLDAWLDYICPGLSISVQSTGNLNSQIQIRNGNLNNKLSAAPNIGFGVSYLLPIVVTGLIAAEGSLFVVENPEAHLHPKAQSNLGFFLGQMAGAGVQILVETHSEHVVNGIRRACLTPRTKLTPEDAHIYFFDVEDTTDSNGSRRKVTYDLIRIEPNGDLSSFPVDFFDQLRQDLFEIVTLSRTNG